MSTVRIETKYGDVLKAAKAQGIPLSRVFAKIEDNNGDGILEAKYPLVKVYGGKIPVDNNGDVIYDIGRVSYAKTLAKMHNEDGAVKAKVTKAYRDILDNANTVTQHEDAQASKISAESKALTKAVKAKAAVAEVETGGYEGVF